MNAALAPIRERRAELVKHPDDVWDVLTDGGNRARARASRVMDKVRTER